MVAEDEEVVVSSCCACLWWAERGDSWCELHNVQSPPSSKRPKQETQTFQAGAETLRKEDTKKERFAAERIKGRRDDSRLWRRDGRTKEEQGACSLNGSRTHDGDGKSAGPKKEGQKKKRQKGFSGAWMGWWSAVCGLWMTRQITI